MRSKTLALALIVLTFLGTGGWSHVEVDDPDFLAPAAAHNHSTHHEGFRSPATRRAAEHCAICHWLQMFRASTPRQARVQFAAAPNDRRVAAAIPPLRAAARIDVPSRAPPA